MKYRKFEAAGLDVSLLGFGTMRLPLLKGTNDVDEAEAIKMLRYAIDNGLNYIDSAYLYHHGTSEGILGKALKDGYREKVLIATKMPYWMLGDPEEMEGVFNKQMERLDVDRIDMYLVHDIRDGGLSTIVDWNIWDFLNKKRGEGKIRYIGFSTHCSTPEYFKEILDYYPWDFCQLQLNFMDKDEQAGLKGYEYAFSKGVPVIAMEPLKGGKLTDILQPSIQERWDSLEPKRSPAEWAFRWVANLPGVLTILSGMSTMEQLEDNIRIFSDSGPSLLSEAELAAMENVADEYRKLIVYECTACGYCLPCTASIDIPEIMDLRNSCDLYGVTDKLKTQLKVWVDVKPSACTECGKCETECPQGLPIMQVMKETAGILE